MSFKIENCSFAFKCPQEWDKLSPTSKINIKHCEECKRDVYMITSQEEHDRHARLNNCVAIIDSSIAIPGVAPTPFEQKIKNDRSRYKHLEMFRMLKALGYSEDDSSIINHDDYMREAKNLVQLGKKRGYLTYGEIHSIIVENDMAGDNLYDLVNACNDCGFYLYEQTPASLGSLNIFFR
jgi:hypothetical protein